MKQEMKEMKKMLKKLGIRESYYHLDDKGNLFYAFLAPGREEKDFKLSYRGDLLTVETEETTVSVRVRYGGMRFNLDKSQATYKDGTLIIKVPPKENVFGKIEVEGA